VLMAMSWMGWKMVSVRASRNANTRVRNSVDKAELCSSRIPDGSRNYITYVRNKHVVRALHAIFVFGSF
jgi:hypothetical protein